jgi:hypothetical protein
VGLVASAGATEVQTRGAGHCARAFDVGRAISNETLHEQVYYWANNHEVRGWQWEKTTASAESLVRWGLSEADGAGLECAGIRYAAGIRIPEPFESLLVLWHMSVEIPLRVEKVVCRGKGVLYEDATIREPVLDEIRMTTKHELMTDFDMESTCKTTLFLPWYAQLLEAQVVSAMDRSVGEKFDAVVRSLCEPQRRSGEGMRVRSKRRSLFPGWSGLRPAPHPFAGPAANTTHQGWPGWGAHANGTHRQHRPHRPSRPANATDTWVVIVLPEEPWPEPGEEDTVVANVPEKLAEKKGPCSAEAPCEKPRLAVRRRTRVVDEAAKTAQTA